MRALRRSHVATMIRSGTLPAFARGAVRNRFDQLAKQIGHEALTASGPTVVNDEIAPDAQHADLRHEPDPRRNAERARLGLLGRMAERPCILEVFSQAPDASAMRAALSKHLAFWQKRTREARGRRRRALADPFLWILAAGRPDTVIEALPFTPAPAWPRGVYLGSDLLNVGLVVASELPREGSTLLVRLMATGPGLRDAVEDLAALPDDAHERQVATQILLNLQHALTVAPKRTDEEQEVARDMEDAFKRLRQEGLEEGRLEATRGSILRVLARRNLIPTREEAATLDACSDLRRLERWLDRAVTADTVADVLGEAAPRRKRTKLAH